MKNASFSQILIIVIVSIIIIGGGIFTWQYFGTTKQEIKAPEEMVESEEVSAPEEVSEPEETVSEPEETIKNGTTNWQTYRNEEYGFELTFPERWQGYKVVEEDSVWGIKTISFQLEREESLVSDNEYYGSIFKITILSKDQWKALQQEEGPTPAYITENDKYVFTISMCQDDMGFKGFPEDPGPGRFYEGPIYDVKTLILPSFKLIEAE